MRNGLVGTCVLAVAMVAQTARAEITAQQTLDWLTRTVADAGMTLTVGSQSGTGRALSLRDIRLGYVEGTVLVVATLDRLDLISQPDGSTRITLPELIPLAVINSAGAGLTATFSLALDSAEVSVSGSARDATLVGRAKNETLTGSGGTVSSSNFLGDVKLALEAPQLRLHFVAPESDPGRMEADLSAARLDLDGGFSVSRSEAQKPGPPMSERMVISADTPALHLEASGLPRMPYEGDAATLLRAGLAARVELRQGENRARNVREFDGRSLTADAVSKSTVLSAGFDAKGARFDAENDGYTMTYIGLLPGAPLTMASDAITMSAALPLLAGPEAGDVIFRLKLAPFTVNDAAWAVVDPTGALPRGPFGVDIDIAGKTRLTRDLVAKDNGDNPFRFDEVTIASLGLSALGAQMAGSGHFAFDYSKPPIANDVPATEGVFDARLSGINAVLDGLIKRGLVPKDAVMPIRLGLALLTRAGDEPDTMTSAIRIGIDGSIFANGQQIK